MLTSNVIELRSGIPDDDIAATLRRYADHIEVGDISFPVTTAILVLGHSETRNVSDGLEQTQFWETVPMGPRVDGFTVRGLLATVMNRWRDDI